MSMILGELADYASLLQLGAGVGIGFSLFEAPVQQMESSVVQKIERFKLLERKSDPSMASQKSQLIIEAEIQLALVSSSIKALKSRAVILSSIGTAINTILLIWVSIEAKQQVYLSTALIFIFFSTVYFLLIVFYIYFQSSKALLSPATLIMQLENFHPNDGQI